MIKKFYGVCPTQNKQYCVLVNYVDCSTFEGKQYTKGRTTCDYVRYGGTCKYSRCPISADAPEKL